MYGNAIFDISLESRLRVKLDVNDLPRLQTLSERRYLRHRQASAVHLIAQFRRRNIDGQPLLQHLTIPLRFPHAVGSGRGGTLSPPFRRHLFRLGNNIFLGRRRRRIRLSGRRAGRVLESHTLDRLSSRRRPRSVRRGLDGRIVGRSDVL